MFIVVVVWGGGGGGGELKTQDSGWIKAVSLAANKSLLHKLFSGT